MRKIAITLIAMFSLLFPIASVGVYAEEFNPLQGSCTDENGKQVIDSEVCNDAQNPEEIIKGEESIFIKVANVLAFLGGAIAVLIIIVAGITMILSAGDPGKVKSSRDAIIYTVVGLFVILLSRSIVIFIINAVDK